MVVTELPVHYLMVCLIYGHEITVLMSTYTHSHSQSFRTSTFKVAPDSLANIKHDFLNNKAMLSQIYEWQNDRCAI